MPICVLYLTDTMPIIWGKGVGPALIFVNANGKYWVIFMLIFQFLQMQMLRKIFVKTIAGGCLFYGQINNIQLNISMKFKNSIPLRYQFNFQVKLADLSGA